jgi:hypothetical protein
MGRYSTVGLGEQASAPTNRADTARADRPRSRVSRARCLDESDSSSVAWPLAWIRSSTTGEESHVRTMHNSPRASPARRQARDCLRGEAMTPTPTAGRSRRRQLDRRLSDVGTRKAVVARTRGWLVPARNGSLGLVAAMAMKEKPWSSPALPRRASPVRRQSLDIDGLPGAPAGRPDQERPARSVRLLLPRPRSLAGRHICS